MNFNEDSSSDDDEPEKYMKRKSQALKTKAKSQEAESYALYDEVYDSMKEASGEFKKVDKNSPQYLQGFLEAKAKRDIDNQIIKNEKQRALLEKDKDLYEDKETFVTSSYRAYQDEQNLLIQSASDNCIRTDPRNPGIAPLRQGEDGARHIRAVEATPGVSEAGAHVSEEEDQGNFSAGLNVVSEIPVSDLDRSEEHFVNDAMPKRIKTQAEKFEELLEASAVSDADLAEYKERYMERIRLKNRT